MNAVGVLNGECAIFGGEPGSVHVGAPRDRHFVHTGRLDLLQPSKCALRCPDCMHLLCDHRHTTRKHEETRAFCSDRATL